MTKYGRKVEQEELKKFLTDKDAKAATTREITEEISELNAGECLAYETSDGFATRLALSTLVLSLRGKKEFSIFDTFCGTEIYVYRVK